MYSGVKEPCPSLHHFMLYVAHGPYMALACSMLRVCRFLRAFASLIFAQSSACWMGARILPGCHSKKDCSSKGAPGSSFSSSETSKSSSARSPSCCKMSASQPASLSLSWPTCCARVEGADPPVGKKVNTSSKSSPRIPWAKERFLALGQREVWRATSRQAQQTSGKTKRAETHGCLQMPLGTSTGKEG